MVEGESLVAILPALGIGGAMAKIESHPDLSLVLPDLSAVAPDPGLSPPSPEEGHRLIRTFAKIRQQALREAVIELVTNLAVGAERSR